MRWLDGLTDSMDMCLIEIREMVKDKVNLSSGTPKGPGSTCLSWDPVPCSLPQGSSSLGCQGVQDLAQILATSTGGSGDPIFPWKN